MTFDTILEDPRWRAVRLGALAASADAATLAHLGLDPGAYETSLLGCDDTRIAELNADFRNKAQATNVLSWPSEDRTADAGGRPALPRPGALGDIAIAYDTCAREAAEQGKEISAHVSHLLVHGILHLLGYDHMTAQDAALMEGLEVEILATMGLPNPY